MILTYITCHSIFTLHLFEHINIYIKNLNYPKIFGIDRNFFNRWRFFFIFLLGESADSGLFPIDVAMLHPDRTKSRFFILIRRLFKADSTISPEFSVYKVRKFPEILVSFKWKQTASPIFKYLSIALSSLTLFRDVWKANKVVNRMFWSFHSQSNGKMA